MSFSMAGRRYTPEERSEALDLYREEGPRAAHRATGVSLSTLLRWAKEAGIATNHAQNVEEAARTRRAENEERRQRIAARLWELADLASQVELELLPEDATLRDVVGLRTRAIHDALLLSGDPTSRVEHQDRASIDAEVQRLAEQLNLTGVERERADR